MMFPAPRCHQQNCATQSLFDCFVCMACAALSQELTSFGKGQLFEWLLRAQQELPLRVERKLCRCTHEGEQKWGTLLKCTATGETGLSVCLTMTWVPVCFLQKRTATSANITTHIHEKQKLKNFCSKPN